ncbi:unnamed protein product [Musa acuminata subsp. burmannicoides]
MGWRRRARIRRRMGILGRHDEQLCLLSPLQESGPTSRSSTPSIRSEAPSCSLFFYYSYKEQTRP